MNAERDPDLVALLERARSFRPFPLPLDGQCLRDALAACLRLPPDRVPARLDYEEIWDWDARVAEALGVKLERMSPDEPPPNEAWIVIVPSHTDEFTHAQAVFGNSPDARGRIDGYRIVAI